MLNAFALEVLPARSPRKPQPLLHKYIATCSPGLERLVIRELQSPAIQAQNVGLKIGIIHFAGDSKVGYNACLWLRCGTRILQEIAQGDIVWESGNADPLYEFVKNAVDWTSFLQSEEPGVLRSFSVETSVRRAARKSSSLYASTSAEAAIRDAGRENGLKFSDDWPRVEPELPLLLSLFKNKARLYRDMSGVSLETRGYRGVVDKESVSGAIAAGILTISGWNKTLPGFGKMNKSPNVGTPALLDPMCGCGTFLIEAALMACNMAPGLLHATFPFENWHDFNKKLWEECRLNALQAAVKPSPDLQLMGNDFDEAALRLCQEEAQRAGVDHLLQLSCKSVRELTLPSRPALVTVNPPWCERIYQEKQSLFATNLYLGRFLKRCCGESDAYILSSGKWIANAWRMRADANWPLTIDGLDFRLLHYYVLK